MRNYIYLLFALILVACASNGGADGQTGASATGESGANGTPGPIGPVGPPGPAGTPGKAAAEPSAPWTNGTRIRARQTTYTVVGADGTKQSSTGWGGWFDTQRNEPCAVTRASDGKQRCLPATGGSVTASYFSDATCTKPVVLVYAAEVTACSAPYAVPAYANSSSTVAGCIENSIHSVGVNVSVMYVKSTTCIPTTIPTYYKVYELGPEVPASSFVEFTVTTQTTN